MTTQAGLSILQRGLESISGKEISIVEEDSGERRQGLLKMATFEMAVSREERGKLLCEMAWIAYVERDRSEPTLCWYDEERKILDFISLEPVTPAALTELLATGRVSIYADGVPYTIRLISKGEPGWFERPWR